MEEKMTRRFQFILKDYGRKADDFRCDEIDDVEDRIKKLRRIKFS